MDPRRQAVPDLSPEAIDARRKTEARSGRRGGATGRELVENAAAVFEQAKRLAKLAQDREAKGKRSRAAAASRRADEALVTAATQAQLALLCPPQKPYMHALTLEQVQEAKDRSARLLDEDDAALAVQVHRWIREGRQRNALAVG